SVLARSIGTANTVPSKNACQTFWREIAVLAVSTQHQGGHQRAASGTPVTGGTLPTTPTESFDSVAKNDSGDSRRPSHVRPVTRLQQINSSHNNVSRRSTVSCASPTDVRNSERDNCRNCRNHILHTSTKGTHTTIHRSNSGSARDGGGIADSARPNEPQYLDAE